MSTDQKRSIEEELPLNQLLDTEFNVDEFKTPFSLKRCFLISSISGLFIYLSEIFFSYRRMFPETQDVITQSVGNFISFALSNFIIVPTLFSSLVCLVAIICSSPLHFSKKTQEHLNEFAANIKINTEKNLKNIEIATTWSKNFRATVKEKEEKIKELQSIIAAQDVALEKAAQSSESVQQEVKDSVLSFIQQLNKTAKAAQNNVNELNRNAIEVSKEHEKKIEDFLKEISQITKYKAANAKLLQQLQAEREKNTQLEQKLEVTTNRRSNVEESQAAGLAALRRLLRATEQSAERLGISKKDLRAVRKRLMAQNAQNAKL